MTPEFGGMVQPAAVGPRAYVASHFALDLEGTPIGFIEDAQGGGVKAEVLEFQQGNEGFTNKQISALSFQDITLQLGLANSKPVYDWIADTWEKHDQRKNGAIIATDFNYEQRARREFARALIAEVTVPALDGSSKDAAFLTVQLTEEGVQYKAASGKLQAATNAKQKLWMSANFRLEIDGVDCTKVTKIDSFTVKQQIIEFKEGQDRLPHKEPGKIEFPNLTVTFAATIAPSWNQWFDDFVLKGNNGDDREKSGRIVFLAPNLKDELGEVNLFHLGITRLDDGVFDPVNEPSALMRAELYVERMTLNIPGGGTPLPPPTPTPTPNSG